MHYGNHCVTISNYLYIIALLPDFLIRFEMTFFYLNEKEFSLKILFLIDENIFKSNKLFLFTFSRRTHYAATIFADTKINSNLFK